MKIIELNGISKKFAGAAAVSNVSEVFHKGEYICILGPSGCGKTTLLRLIAGFEEPDGGEIFLEGKSLTHIPPERRNVNMVFQDYALFPHMTVYENVAFGLKMKKYDRRALTGRVNETLALVGMGAYAARFPRQLSGGEKQRVALARALVNSPAALLLDEPLAAMDRNLRLEMQEELKKIQQDTGITFLHVTHDQEEALSMAHRLAIMKKGRIVQAGPPQILYDEPLNRFVAEFLGTSNIIEAPYAEDNPTRLIPSENIRLHCEKPAPFLKNKDEKNVFLIRPERIRLFDHHPGYDVNVLEGIVTGVKYIGGAFEGFVETGGTILRVKILEDGRPLILRQGEAVHVYIAPRDIVPLAAADGE